MPRTRAHSCVSQDEVVFSDAQREQLQQTFNFSAVQLDDALLTCTYLLQHAAYETLKPNRFGNQLQAAEVAAEQAIAFVRVWEQRGAGAIEALKDLTLAPKVLTDSHWRLHLVIGQDTLAKRRELTSIIQFDLQDNTSGKPKEEKLVVEFSEEELGRFYAQLETVQEQLDAVQR